jgi:hypothetical protein
MHKAPQKSPGASATQRAKRDAIPPPPSLVLHPGSKALELRGASRPVCGKTAIPRIMKCYLNILVSAAGGFLARSAVVNTATGSCNHGWGTWAIGTQNCFMVPREPAGTLLVPCWAWLLAQQQRTGGFGRGSVSSNNRSNNSRTGILSKRLLESETNRQLSSEAGGILHLK